MTRLLLAWVLSVAAVGDRPESFAITVVDDRTGRGVPLVELKTVNNIVYVTDSAGVVAFDEPGLLGQDVHFTIRSFGYTFPKDGFGIAGKTLKTFPGGSAELRIHRDNLAERLYRTTGGGIYRDSVLVGKNPPIRDGLLNARVLGQDSIQSVVFGGEILWFWGDTNRPSYPLGNFHMPVASSDLPSHGGLDPLVGINLKYETDANGFARGSAIMPGDGPTWLGGLTVLREEDGKERLFAVYDKIRYMLETYQRGLVEWDPQARTFQKLREFSLDEPLYPQGHPFVHDVDGASYIYFPTPLPLIRVPATVSSFLDFSTYEAFTPYREGSRGKQRELDRDPQGRIVFGWKKNTVPANASELARLVSTGSLRGGENAFPLRDIDTGKPIVAHGGSVQWNPYRNRWVMIFVTMGGKSILGEVYYAEADSPLGPWVYARKIATHAQDGRVYSFYNPKHHAFLDQDGGRTIFFEGTYTTTFSGNDEPTPRYDYNQIMYKLYLSNPSLALPVAIYQAADGTILGPVDANHPERRGRSVAFFAYDRFVDGSVPVTRSKTPEGHDVLTIAATKGSPLFFVKSIESSPSPENRLLKMTDQEGNAASSYAIEPPSAVEGAKDSRNSLGWVWTNPTEINLPRD